MNRLLATALEPRLQALEDTHKDNLIKLTVTLKHAKMRDTRMCRWRSTRSKSAAKTCCNSGVN